MSDYAWVSQIFSNSSKFPTFEPYYVGRERYADPDPGEFMFRYWKGEPLGPEYFPDEMSLDLDPEYEDWPSYRFSNIGWASTEQDPTSAFITHYPEISWAGRNIIISARCLEIFRRFDTGAIAFYPIKLFQSDYKTPIGDDWFCMTFANVKQVFLPREMRNIYKNSDTRWSLSPLLEDYEAELRAAARQGPEIWADPYLLEALFFSGSLGDALADAGLLECLAPVCKARIVSR